MLIVYTHLVIFSFLIQILSGAMEECAKKLRARVCYSKLGRRQRVTQAIFQTTKLRFIFQGGEAIYATVQFLTSDTDTEILYFERLCVTTFSKYYHLRMIFLFFLKDDYI